MILETNCSFNCTRFVRQRIGIFTHTGIVGIALSAGWSEPKNPYDQSNLEASERALMFDFGWFASPLVYGDWPDIMKETVARRSTLQGFKESRLPPFTDEEKRMLKGDRSNNLHLSKIMIQKNCIAF